MATYTQILYHIVYGTKDHNGTLNLERHDELCRYTAGILMNNNCFVYKVGGHTEHLHILTGLHPTIALANVVKDLKLAQSKWIKKKNVFPAFDNWQDGYGAFTCSWKDKERIINYIANQIEHHHHKTFRGEYIEMLQQAGIEFDEKYLC
ncbi:MAG: transposase [Phycisphaerae bacterium]|nr:transposase [Phycisphaerae bacterium]